MVSFQMLFPIPPAFLPNPERKNVALGYFLGTNESGRVYLGNR